ncbi:MAG TPA: hypothetical protein VGC31_05140, partial [Paenirhodobacter sp.]
AALLAADGVPPEARVLAVSADLRYRGQASELVVPWPDAAATAEALARLAADFHTGHEQRFSYANTAAPLELVALLVTATGLLSGGTERATALRPPADVAASETRPMLSNGVWTDVAVYRRDRITAEIHGLALVEEEYTTIMLSPDGAAFPARWAH